MIYMPRLQKAANVKPCLLHAIPHISVSRHKPADKHSDWLTAAHTGGGFAPSRMKKNRTTHGLNLQRPVRGAPSLLLLPPQPIGYKKRRACLPPPTPGRPQMTKLLGLDQATARNLYTPSEKSLIYSTYPTISPHETRKRTTHPQHSTHTPARTEPTHRRS